MSYPIREERGNMASAKEVGSTLNALQMNQNYKNNEAGDNYKSSNAAPPKQNLGNPFGGNVKKSGRSLKK